MEGLLQDLRYALRQLAKNPGFTTIAVLTLALGIGANTAIFSVINAVLLRPLPYHDPAELVMLWETNRALGNDRNVISPANLLDWKAQDSLFSSMAAAIDWRVAFTGSGEPEEIAVEYATASLFPLLGAKALLGRPYTAEEDAPSGPRVVVLGQALWERRFSGDRAVVGKSMTLNGRSYTIVGVMPAGFGFPASRAHIPGASAQIWMPLSLDPARDYRVEAGRFLQALGRLKPGVTPARAQTELATIGARLERQHPRFNQGWGVNVVPLDEQMATNGRAALSPAHRSAVSKRRRSRI